MKLSQCNMGQIVVDNDGNIGHIVGLSHSSSSYAGAENNAGEVIPLVKWSYKELPHAIHHKNLSILK